MSNTIVRHWSAKFRHAFRGIRVGISGQSSFLGHAVMAVLVMIAAVVLNVSLIEWCTLVVCIGVVLAAELFNTAVECLAKAVTREFDDHVRDALDIASSAVLVAAVSASVVGVTIFAFRLGVWMGWWAEYLLI